MPFGVRNLGRVVLLPERLAVPPALLRMQLPARLREHELLLLHVPQHHLPAAKELRRYTVHVPAARAAGSNRGLAFAHEALAGCAHERDGLGEEDAHGVT